jgi:hypothetical protein
LSNASSVPRTAAMQTRHASPRCFGPELDRRFLGVLSFKQVGTGVDKSESGEGDLRCPRNATVIRPHRKQRAPPVRRSRGRVWRRPIRAVRVGIL